MVVVASGEGSPRRLLHTKHLLGGVVGLLQYIFRFAPWPLQLAPGPCRLHWPPAAAPWWFELALALVRQHSNPQPGPGPAHNDPGQLVALHCPEHLSMPQVRSPGAAIDLPPCRGCPGQYWTKQAPLAPF